jgi:riboflavin synthase
MYSMFTGIVTDVGRIAAVTSRGDLRARISTAYDTDSIDIGASIACDGVCLTVVALGPPPGGWFEVDVSAETVAHTAIARHWTPGAAVNLERALRVGDELGGHIVSGHVDGVARIVAMRPEGDSIRVSLEVPRTLSRYVAPKGSVALNGTSLTVNEVADDGDVMRFGVNLIPHTRAVTNWGDAAVGDAVNVEIDTMARYVARLREAG